MIWRITWNLNPRPRGVNGYIVQHVKVFNVNFCCWPPFAVIDSQHPEWYEAWEVVDGVVFQGPASSGISNGGEVDEVKGSIFYTHGSFTTTLEAYFFPGLTQPKSWNVGADFDGNPILISPTAPFWTSAKKSNEVSRSQSASWDCCTDPGTCNNHF